MNFRVSSEINIEDFKNMTFQSYAEKLSDENIITIGGYYIDIPAGLLVAKLEGNKAKVLTIFVLEHFRNKDLGTKLMEALDVKLKELEIYDLELTYLETLLTKRYLEGLLDKTGWGLIQTSYYSYQNIINKDIRNSKFMRRALKYKLDPDYTIFNWIDWLKFNGENEKLKDEIRGLNSYGPSLDPFLNLENIEPMNSLGISYKGKVIGWMINKRYLDIDPKAIFYEKFFIAEKFRATGAAYFLLVKSIELQLDVIDKIPIGTFRVDYKNLGTIKFVDKQLSEIVYLKDIAKTIIKNLAV